MKIVALALAALALTAAPAAAATESEVAVHVVYVSRSAEFDVGTLAGVPPRLEVYVDRRRAPIRESAEFPGLSVSYARGMVVTLIVTPFTVHVQAISRHGRHRLAVVERWSR